LTPTLPAQEETQPEATAPVESQPFSVLPGDAALAPSPADITPIRKDSKYKVPPKGLPAESAKDPFGIVKYAEKHYLAEHTPSGLVQLYRCDKTRVFYPVHTNSKGEELNPKARPSDINLWPLLVGKDQVELLLPFQYAMSRNKMSKGFVGAAKKYLKLLA